jgi:hypothetical protein
MVAFLHEFSAKVIAARQTIAKYLAVSLGVLSVLAAGHANGQAICAATFDNGKSKYRRARADLLPPTPPVVF